VTTYVQLALYPDPDEHFAYVAVSVDELRGLPPAYRVVCPADGCDLDKGRLFGVFAEAWELALSHRRELLDEWLQASIPSD
jgi:hypothetical protein